jgi:hypothetical protein
MYLEFIFFDFEMTNTLNTFLKIITNKDKPILTSKPFKTLFGLILSYPFTKSR